VSVYIPSFLSFFSHTYCVNRDMSHDDVPITQVRGGNQKRTLADIQWVLSFILFYILLWYWLCCKCRAKVRKAKFDGVVMYIFIVISPCWCMTFLISSSTNLKKSSKVLANEDDVFDSCVLPLNLNYIKLNSMQSPPCQCQGQGGNSWHKCVSIARLSYVIFV
jgi:hypothetical protein